MASIWLSGCHLTFEIPQGNPARLVVQSRADGIADRLISPNHPLVQYVNHWLAVNPDGWEYGLITRPAYVSLSAASYNVDILEHEVTVKTCQSKRICNLWIKKDDSLMQGIRDGGILRKV